MGLIERLPIEFTNLPPNYPKLYQDAIINPGTLALFDFGRPYSYAGNVVPSAGTVLATGTVLRNLVEGGPSITVQGGTAQVSGGGILLDGNTILDLGNNYSFAANNHNFAVQLYFKQTVAANAYGQLIGRSLTTNAGGCQYRLDFGPGGVRMRAAAGGSTSVSVAQAAVDNSLNTVYQFGLSREGAALSLHRNGALHNQSLLGDATLANPAGNITVGQEGFKGLIYRIVIEDLSVSGKTSTAQAAADYAANSARIV